MKTRRFPTARTLSGATLLTLMTVVGCNNPKGGGAPPAPPPPAVTVAQPILQSVQTYHEYNGYLDAVDKVEVRARVKGLLTKVHFVEGADVEAGKTTLYDIEPREYEAAVARADADIEKAKADVANAEFQLPLAKEEVDRVMKAGSGVSPSERDKARTTLAAVEAQLRSGKANIQAGEAAMRTAKINLERTTIKAEIDGQIGRTLVTPGNLVGQTDATLLTTIVKMDELFVEFDAPERNLLEFLRSPMAVEATGESRTIPVEVGVATETGYPHVGRIDFRDNIVDRNTGTIHLRGRLKNPKGNGGTPPLLYSGLYARVRVPIGEKQEIPVIPEEALMTGQEGRFVYVLGPGDVVQKRTVVVSSESVWKNTPTDGAARPTWNLTDAGGGTPIPLQSIVAITKGLTVNDRLVVNGVLKARPGSPVTPEVKVLQPPPAKP